MNYFFITISIFIIFLGFSILSLFPMQNSFTETKSLWPIGTSMSTYRTEITPATIGDNIYVIGGIDKPSNALDTVEVYNIKNDSWKKVTPLPQPLHHSAASSFNGKIYVIGGSSSSYSSNDWIPSNKLFIYDPVADKWIEGKPMPTARGGMTANFVNGILYVVGGYGSSQIVDVNEAYDPLLNEWTSKKPMPTARHHAVSAVVDNQLFVIGGTRMGFYPIVNTNITERYDPIEDKWVTLESMHSKRSGSSAVSINNNTATIYVFDGVDFPEMYNDYEKYDVKSNKWESQRSIPISNFILGVVSINDNKIYVIAGLPTSGLTVTNMNETFDVKRK